MMLYRIKPLEWETTANGISVDSPIGWIRIYRMPSGRGVFVKNDSADSYETIDEAKAAAEQFYQDRMKAGLVEATIDDCVQYSAKVAHESIDAHHRKNKLGPYSEALTPQSKEQEVR